MVQKRIKEVNVKVEVIVVIEVENGGTKTEEKTEVDEIKENEEELDLTPDLIQALIAETEETDVVIKSQRVRAMTETTTILMPMTNLGVEIKRDSPNLLAL